MRGRTTTLIAVSSLALWVGCIPLYPTVRDARHGRIVDAESGRPIANALVRVESYQVSVPPVDGGNRTLLHTFEVRTFTDGSWGVPSERDWTVGILAADGFPLYVDVYCVFADGYEPEIRDPMDGRLSAGAPSQQNRREREMPFELGLARKSTSRVMKPSSVGVSPRVSPCGVGMHTEP